MELDAEARELLDDACNELECLEAAMMKAITPTRDEDDMALEHYVRSIADIRGRLESALG